jgi:hypothetical protein
MPSVPGVLMWAKKLLHLPSALGSQYRQFLADPVFKAETFRRRTFFTSSLAAR